MQLSLTQRQTLKTFILANYPSQNDQEIANSLNVQASPDFWVWRTSVTKGEFVQSASVDGTTFTWVGNGFITRSAGEQAAWRELFNHVDSCNPSLANVRQAFTDIFSGTGNAAANRTHLATVARRRATVAEKTLATGTGSTASPATLGATTANGITVYAEGPVTVQDVIDSLNS